MVLLNFSFCSIHIVLTHLWSLLCTDGENKWKTPQPPPSIQWVPGGQRCTDTMHSALHGAAKSSRARTRACTVLGCDHIQRGKQPEKLGAASQRCQESSCCVWRIHHSTISLWYRRAGEPLLPGTGILPSKCLWLLKLMSGNSPYTGATSLPPAGAAASAEFRAH